MLGKLTKYEFKATARIFLPFYLAVFGVTLVNKCFILINDKAELSGIIETVFTLVQAIMMLAGIVMIAATLFLTFFMIVQRFYKNLFTDEGYLMHTLPVKAGNHILAKLITSSVWTIASVLVVILAVFLLVASGEVIDFIKDFFSSLPELIKAFEQTFGINFYWTLSAVIALAVIALPCNILIFYLSITLGSVLLPKHKIGGAFVGYLIIYTATQMVTGVFLILSAFVFGGNAEVIFESSVPPAKYLYFYFGFMALSILITGITCYFVSVHIMQKKLNLE